MRIAATKIPARSNMFPAVFVLLIAVALGGIYFVFVRSQPARPVDITQSELEEAYGLHVNLVAVTAAGGFVDVRIKIVDGEKAKALLSDKKNFPALSVSNRIILNAPEDVKSQEIRFENDGTMFIMFANSSGVVKHGTPVKILFGNIQVGTIEAR